MKSSNEAKEKNGKQFIQNKAKVSSDFIYTSVHTYYMSEQFWFKTVTDADVQ